MEPETAKERRLNDIDWRGHIDRRLNVQDQTLSVIQTTLDGHIKTTAALKQRMEPVADAMETMKSGIKVIGWIGSKVTAIAIGLSAIIGILAWWHQGK